MDPAYEYMSAIISRFSFSAVLILRKAIICYPIFVSLLVTVILSYQQLFYGILVRNEYTLDVDDLNKR